MINVNELFPFILEYIMKKLLTLEKLDNIISKCA